MPGTRYGARPDASKQEPKSVPGTRCDARPDASKQGPKSVPGTRCGAGSDAPESHRKGAKDAKGNSQGRKWRLGKADGKS